MTQILSSAQAKRKELQSAALAIGVTPEYISILVDAFYARIRTDQMLGPIFNRVIDDQWDPHLEKMKSFWGSVALHTGTYSGQPVPKHKALKGVDRAKFDLWLKMFRETLENTAPSDQVICYFMERAERIAESLQLAMFGGDGLPPVNAAVADERTE